MRGVDRPQHGRNSGRVLERGDEAAAILALDPGRAAAGARGPERLRRVVHVRREARNRHLARPDTLPEQPPQLVQSLARLGGDDDERRAPEAVLGQEAPDVGAPGVNVPGREEIGLVQNDRHRRRV